MKKVLVIFMLFATLVCSIGLTGCKNDVKVDSFNSYVVTIYEEVYKQDDYGKVEFQGLKLKKSFQVPKTQMFELDIEFYKKNDELCLGKYYYDIDGTFDMDKTYASELDENSKKVTIFPKSDLIITMRKREIKTVNVYYDGQVICNYYYDLEKTLDYYDTFQNTYEEYLTIPSARVADILSHVGRTVKVEVYNTPEFYGEPIYQTEFVFSQTLRVTDINLHILKSTDLYLRVYY